MDPYGQGPVRAFRGEKEWAVTPARQTFSFLSRRPPLPLRETSLNATIALVLLFPQLTAVQASALVLQLSHFALPLPFTQPTAVMFTSSTTNHTRLRPSSHQQGKQPRASGCSERRHHHDGQMPAEVKPELSYGP